MEGEGWGYLFFINLKLLRNKRNLKNEIIKDKIFISFQYGWKYKFKTNEGPFELIFKNNNKTFINMCIMDPYLF